jgi:hypothetical protein
MSERFSFTCTARPDEVFAAGAFDQQVGQQWPVKMPGHRNVQGTLVSAEIAADGRSVTCTVEVPDGTLPPQRLPGASIGWRP